MKKILLSILFAVLVVLAAAGLATIFTIMIMVIL